MTFQDYTAEDFTCSICGKVATPIFQTPDKDGKPHLYCGEHNPVTQEERDEMWGITPDMKKSKRGIGRPKL